MPENFSVGDWVVVTDPRFYQEECLELGTKFKVVKVENPEEFPFGPGCSYWNNSDCCHVKPNRLLKNECGRSVVGFACYCREFREQCHPHQRVHIQVPQEQIFYGSPSGYGISGAKVQKTTPPT